MKHQSFKILMTIFCLCMVSGIAYSQQAGQIISGVVEDEFGPLPHVNIVEISSDNRIVVHTVTDINGNFSFAIVNPKDKIRIAYVGCETQVLPLDRLVYKIVMSGTTTLQEVTVSAQKHLISSGLAIPEREVSVAAQQISAQEFEGLAVTSIDEALQGRVSGLDIVFNSGNLGAGTSMRLRGVSTINGNAEPLIVVDGKVWDTDYKDFDFGSATEEQYSELLGVNPDDIDDITVLKDASATAIWGSQGANGVIEIKTKRGSRGPTKVSYSYRLNGTYQPEGIHMMDGDEYTMYLKEAYFNPDLSDAASDIAEINYDPSFSEYQMYNNNTDWRDAVKQIGREHKHYVSLSGGGEKANFRVTGGYDHQTGSIIAQSLDRFTTRTALDYFVSNRIKIVTNFSMTYTDNHKNSMTYTDNHKNTGDLLSIAYQKMPNLSIYEEDINGNSTGEYYHMLTTASDELSDQKSLVNPIALAYEALNTDKSLNIQPEFNLVYNLLGLSGSETRLTYDGRIVFNIYNNYSDAFYPSSLVSDNWASSSSNKASSSTHKSFGMTTTHTMTFIPVFSNTDHSFMAMLRGQMTKGESKSQSTGLYGLPSGTIQSPSAEGIINTFSTSAGEWRSIYFTFSAHYAYQGKYILDFSLRRDGTSKFGPTCRWGNFPGLSLRWNISDEPFMSNVGWINMLSLRPGWGIGGSQPGSEYLYYVRYASGNSYLNSGSVNPNNIALLNLKWEQKESYNLGCDISLFKDKLYADVNVYTAHTTDLRMPSYKIPTSSGFSTLSYKNGGEMRNTGWEFNINTNQVIKSGKFSVDFNVSFANNSNRILAMEESVLDALNKDFDHSNGSYLTRVQLNNPFGSIYGFRYKGVYQYSDYSENEIAGVSGPNAPVVRGSDGEVILDDKGLTKPMYFCYGVVDYEFKGGDAIYEDINHDGNINELDMVYLGSSLPKLTGGFGIKLAFGRIRWNNQFNFRFGNKIINKARMLAESMYDNNNQSAAVNWRWRVEGDETVIPRALYGEGYNWLGSDRFVEDGSFVRLNYSQISYSIDPKLVKPLGISQMSFYISGNNIFCLTAYSGADPEVGYGSYSVVYDTSKTPRSKSFTIGTTIQF